MKLLRDGRRIHAERLAGSVPGLPLAVHTFGRLSLLVGGANVAGGVVVGLLLVALNADSTTHQRDVVGVVGAIYGAAAVAVGIAVGFALQGRTLRWIARRRIPTREEARRALRNPIDLAVLTGILWVIGAVLIAVVAAMVDVRARVIFGLSGGLVLAGLTTAGVTYLIASRVGRPIAVLALEVYPPTERVILTLRAGILAIWALATGVPLLGIVLILSSPPGRSHIVGAGLFAAIVALVVGGLAIGLVARSIGEPLRTMVTAVRLIGKGQLDTTVEVDDMGEIGMLQRGVNDMVEGLRERVRIQDLFGRHVGPAVASEAILGGVTLRGESRDVVALFVDITGSTRLTRENDPQDFVAMLNRFFGIVVDAVESSGGLVNKFEGDAALCVFGAPAALDDPATAALVAARRIRDEVHEGGEVEVGIGVASGPVIAGQIGAASRLEYTVIGDAVNEAARLTELAKRVEGRVLASEATVEAASASEREHWVKGRTLRLRGRDAPTHTYRSVVPAKVG